MVLTKVEGFRVVSHQIQSLRHLGQSWVGPIGQFNYPDNAEPGQQTIQNQTTGATKASLKIFLASDIELSNLLPKLIE